MFSCKARLAGLGCLLLALASCGDLPQPYRGRPGGQAGVLAIPLALRIAVPPPEQALLASSQAKSYAEAMTSALQAQDVPATVTEAPKPLDWRVEMTADRQGQKVRPRFRLLDGDLKEQAATEASPVALRDWAEADRPLFNRVAAEAAPKLTQMLLAVEAARKSTTPAALAAGPPRIYMRGVAGAPGDGNAALAARIKEFLGGDGFVVQDSAQGATYGLHTEVRVVPAGTPGVERVEIQWIISRWDGEELGRVVQMNEVPAGRLNRLWGDIAYVAAQEASAGVKTVVANAQPGPANPDTGAAPKPEAANAAPAAALVR
ncbi:hypothetical protein [Roseicella aquatilis]|uniref:Lipoprotein n=1 Tax=Roseicella aquatilis TaxID=2527868 RepID=A0A4R4DHS7_9PROT|nr:hypothetical protein [Roseicella aquatilis]TCZ59932.1 hypothetical protein EXY23_15170 [Roseicella aquatilis]